MAKLFEKRFCPYCMRTINSKNITYYCGCGQKAEYRWVDGERRLQCTDSSCIAQRFILKHDLCAAELPFGILQYSGYLRFSVLGLVGSGKTTYITAMLHDMQHSEGWSLGAMNPETGAEYNQNYLHIFQEHRAADHTVPGFLVTQQWYMNDKRRNYPFNYIPSYSLTIFDGAGEDARIVADTVQLGIRGAKTLLILFDPLSLPGVTADVQGDQLEWSRGGVDVEQDAAGMIDALVSYIRSCLDIPPTRRITKNCAIVFTKIDMFRQDFMNSTVMQPSPHMRTGGFVESDSVAVDNDIRAWLKRKNQDHFLNKIEGNFVPKNVRYFGVSSFGQPPIGTYGDRIGEFAAAVPHRVLDPLLWMMYKEGILRRVKMPL